MKKFAYLVMLVTAVTFTSCFLENSHKDNEEQQEQQGVGTLEEPVQQPVTVETFKPRETPEIIKEENLSHHTYDHRARFLCRVP